MKDSGLSYKIVASIEINNVANEIYKLNFPETTLCNANIEGLTSEFINKLKVNIILMSPPCQPFTRNGSQNDTKDSRTASFIHILKILPDLEVNKILIENVKGFEKSDMREILVETLNKCGFEYQEFIISPHQLGIPNSRHRYYCLAKKNPGFSFEIGPLKEELSTASKPADCFSLESILESNIEEKYLLSDKILQKYFSILDICYKTSKRSCCFTKAYGRFIEGTGSVFTNKTENEVAETLNTIKSTELDPESKLKLLKSLGLRFFTPREVCRFMCFPDSFVFPQNIGDRKKYMVLGNSVNIKVVSELIKLLSNYFINFYLYQSNFFMYTPKHCFKKQPNTKKLLDNSFYKIKYKNKFYIEPYN